LSFSRGHRDGHVAMTHVGHRGAPVGAHRGRHADMMFKVDQPDARRPSIAID
jgi:hypothetical protein